MASAQDAVESIFGAVHENITYELTITDVEPSLLRVANFTATENLSLPFTYEITVGTDPESVASLEEALGRDASFTIEKDGKVVRVVHGIIANVAPDGIFVGKTQARVAFVLEPRLSNLRYRGGFRIFQNMAIHEIVGEICQAEQIDCLWHVLGVPAKREYCTQLDESDLDFITRIASEEGMHYFFTHDEKKTTVIFANESDGYVEIEADLALSFNDTQGAVTGEHVRSIQRGQSIRVGAVEHRDYNFVEPNIPLLGRAETKGTETTANSHKREWRDYPGRFLDNGGKGKSNAQMRLDEMRSDAFVLSGTASSLRFSAGRTFTLEGHRDDGFNRKLILKSIQFSGVVQGALRDGSGSRATTKLATFTAIPAETTIHPLRISKPTSRLHSARVVGPKDGDPYVDEHGRVKVQFFWDRDAKFDEKSSCWIRMMTPVAHLDEGFWQAHKVGSEVIVGFLDDDIDRPIIMGAVYNAVQSQPHPLPSQVSKSTWKTKSIPGNAGFNEITHDNTAGKEELFVHAQRDHKVIVGHNEVITVAANQTVSVGANQTVSIGANRTVSTGANETISVGANRSETVDKKEDVTVKLGRTHTINSGGDTLHVISGARKIDIDAGNHETTVSALTKLETEDMNSHARKTITLTGDVKILVQQGATTATFEGGNVTFEVAGVTKVHHSGTTVLIEDSGKVKIDAAPEVEIDCAGAQVKISGGKIEMSAPSEIKLSVGGSGVKISGTGVETSGPSIKSTATSGMNEVSGLVVKLN